MEGGAAVRGSEEGGGFIDRRDRIQDCRVGREAELGVRPAAKGAKIDRRPGRSEVSGMENRTHVGRHPDLPVEWTDLGDEQRATAAHAARLPQSRQRGSGARATGAREATGGTGAARARGASGRSHTSN